MEYYQCHFRGNDMVEDQNYALLRDNRSGTVSIDEAIKDKKWKQLVEFPLFSFEDPQGLVSRSESFACTIRWIFTVYFR